MPPESRGSSDAEAPDSVLTTPLAPDEEEQQPRCAQGSTSVKPSKRLASLHEGSQDLMTKNSTTEAGNAQLSEEDDISCLICLASSSTVADRAILPLCLHSLFCFPCILQWSDQKRSCPLCNRDIGPYIIHNVHSESDYERHYLRPLSGKDRASEAMDSEAAARSIEAERIRRQRLQLHRAREASNLRPRVAPREGERSGWTELARAERAQSDAPSNDPLMELERALDRRKLIYRQGLYALHLGSNRYTGFGASPSSAQMASKPRLVANILPFLRREIMALPLGPAVDIHFLTTYVVSITKAMDIRSEGSARLLNELFSSDEVPGLADHFCHEVMTFLRSGARSCREFDARARYAWPWMQQRPSRVVREKSQAASASTRPDPPSAFPSVASGGYHTAQQGTASPSYGALASRTDNKATIAEPQTGSSDLMDATAAPSREEVIARRGQLLSRLAEEKDRLRQGSAGLNAPPQSAELSASDMQSPQDSDSSATIPGPTIASTGSREKLLRRLVAARMQLAQSQRGDSTDGSTSIDACVGNGLNVHIAPAGATRASTSLEQRAREEALREQAVLAMKRRRTEQSHRRV